MSLQIQILDEIRFRRDARVLQQLKQRLVKQFVVQSIYLGEEYITIDCTYKNFLRLNAKQLTITANGQPIDFEVTSHSRNTLVLQLPTQILHRTQSQLHIALAHNGKRLWLQAGDRLEVMQGLNGGLYQLEVDQQIVLQHLQLGYTYINEPCPVHFSKAGDELEVTDGSDHSTPIEALLLLNSKHMKTLDCHAGKVNVAYTQEEIAQEAFYVYAVKGLELYPIEVSMPLTFKRYFMQYHVSRNTITINRVFYKVSDVQITQLADENHLNIAFETPYTLRDDDDVQLGIVDVNYSQVQFLDTTIGLNKVSAKLDLSTIESVKTKKVFICINEHTYLLTAESLKFKTFHTLEDEIYQLNINSRNGMTLKYRKPKFKVGVNSYDDQHLNIYFQPHAVYQHCNYYLTFEERESEQTWSQPIERGEQSVSLDYQRLSELLTKKKSIIDVFVTVYDGETLVRKQKIKYKTGIYKKDKVQTLVEQAIGARTVYFMMTLTPFKNIKFETFDLSTRELQILNDNNVKNNNIWMIGERTDTAQESGIQMFKWLQEHTDVEAYYVIDETSEDYAGIQHLDHVLRFGSEDHLRIAPQAQVLMCTHDIENIMPYKAAPGFWGYEDTTKIFLQHGVLGRKNVEYHRKYYESPFDLFNVSSDYEKRDVVMKEMGYKDEEVAVTGLPRFDRLPLEPRKKIKRVLIMPTWRDWLNSTEAFTHSEYLKRYMSLINNEQLLKLSEQYQLELNFYPHYRAQSFFKMYLEDNAASQVNYVELGKETVQDLLINHDLLITDYSSVSFDFSYMNKPVLFYHFDVAHFFRKGILRPINDTFIGDIAYSENELIYNIEAALKRTHGPIGDRNLIFNHIDHHNCERVYEAIMTKV